MKKKKRKEEEEEEKKKKKEEGVVKLFPNARSVTLYAKLVLCSFYNLEGK